MSALKALAIATAVLIGASSFAIGASSFAMRPHMVRHNAAASGGAGTHSTAVRTGSFINTHKIHRHLNGYPPH